MKPLAPLAMVIVSLMAALGTGPSWANEAAPPSLSGLLKDLQAGVPQKVEVPDGTYTTTGCRTLTGLRGSPDKPVVIRTQHRGRIVEPSLYRTNRDDEPSAVAEQPIITHPYSHPGLSRVEHFPTFITMKHLPLALSLSSTLLLLGTGCQSEPESSTPPPPQSASASVTPSRFASAAAVDPSGWVTTASGLRYQILASGASTGQSPAPYDRVTVHYRGTLTNGSVFDSSYDRGEPATFGVGQVIPGWTEALQLMKPGDKWTLYIPSNLAYGSRAVGGKIPANSDLIFPVELLKIN